MTIFRLFLFLIALSSTYLEAADKKTEKKNVGLCIVATGRYDSFVEPLIKSARKHFCREHNVTFFVFTDGTIPAAKDIVRVEQPRMGWPYDTMKRFHVYEKNSAVFKNMDYLFALDADMLFVRRVGGEILSKLTATQHPGYVGKRGTYETNAASLAFVKPNEGKIYFAGGFWGASRGRFIKVCRTLNARIDQDLKNNIIAVWHDESHLNRYLINNPPKKVLTPSYCYPESVKIPFKKRLIALDKNHGAMRK